jgi:endonuclease/exonuclease/phosphatase family metal-dependent hydrolase
MTGLWWEYLKFWRVFKSPKGLDSKIIDKLRSLTPDIVALTEVDTGSIRSHKNQADFFEKKLGMSNHVEKIKYPIEGWLRLFHYIPILKNQGNAILAKNKLYDVKYHMLHRGTKRVVIEASVDIPNKVTLLLAHLSLGGKARFTQINELKNIVNNIKNPVILMGDFNTFKGDDEIKELLNNTHLNHRFEMSDIKNTFTQPSVHPSRRLDYVLTSDAVNVLNYKVLDYQFSDHLPLLVDFTVGI